MPSLESDDVDRALTSKLECEVDRSTGDHVLFLIRDPESGKLVRYTKLSRGSKHTLSPRRIAEMAKQLGVETSVLVGLVRCSVSKQQFIRAVGQRHW